MTADEEEYEEEEEKVMLERVIYTFTYDDSNFPIITRDIRSFVGIFITKHIVFFSVP